jgi:flagellar motor switch/type III secretory pathway protein FliN
MSRSLAIRWVPEAVALALADRLQSVLLQWAKNWGLEAALGEITCKAISHSWAHENLKQLQKTPESAAGAEFLFDDEGLQENLAAQLFGLSASSESVVAPRVATQAIQALKGLLRSAAGEAQGAVDSPASNHIGNPKNPGHWGVLASFCLAGKAVQAACSAALLTSNGLLVMPKPPPLKRWSAEEVMADLPVQMKAVIGGATVDVGDLASLSVGDVIVVSQTSNDTIRLRGVDAAIDIPAHIGSCQQHRAVQVQPSSKQARK